MQPDLKKVEFRAPIHLALDEFAFGDLIPTRPPMCLIFADKGLPLRHATLLTISGVARHREPARLQPTFPALMLGDERLGFPRASVRESA